MFFWPVSQFHQIIFQQILITTQFFSLVTIDKCCQIIVPLHITMKSFQALYLLLSTIDFFLNILFNGPFSSEHVSLSSSEIFFFYFFNFLSSIFSLISSGITSIWFLDLLDSSYTFLLHFQYFFLLYVLCSSSLILKI